MQTLDGFVLTQHYHQKKDGLELQFWLHSDSGPVLYTVDSQEAVFFIRQPDLPAVRELLTGLRSWRYGAVELRSLDFSAIEALYFKDIGEYREAIKRIQAASIDCFEEDIRPTERFLMERFINGGIQLEGAGQSRFGVRHFNNARSRAIDYTPNLKVLSFDIETSMRGQELYSIGMAGQIVSDEETSNTPDFELVLMRGEGDEKTWLKYYQDERQLLQAFIVAVRTFDPDLLVGWNVINFDLRFLQKKSESLGIPLILGRKASKLHLRNTNTNFTFASLPGRAVIDGIDCLKGATYHFESYALDNVAREMLGRGKDIDHVDNRGEEITRLFHEDKQALARYNLEDCRLVLEIFEKAGLIRYLIARSQMTGLPLDKVGGSAAAFDNLYLPRLHRHGFVAPVYASGEGGLGSPGGYVMDSLPGLYDHVLVLDFKSLYPSIIRTFKIDPMGLVKGLACEDEQQRVAGFLQAQYHRDLHILPGLLEQLWVSARALTDFGNQDRSLLAASLASSVCRGCGLCHQSVSNAWSRALTPEASQSSLGVLRVTSGSWNTV